MVWAISQLRRSMELGKLKITDRDRRPMKNLQFGKNGQVSLDVHLGPMYGQWKEPEQNNPTPFDISNANGIPDKEYIKNHLKNNTVFKSVPETGLIINPGEFYLWEIYEYIKMPEDAFARIETKSKWAQIGISAHNTAPAIHPGWPRNDPDQNERVVLEITNTSRFPIVLYPKIGVKPGTVIAQIFFEDVCEASTCSTFAMGPINDFKELWHVFFGWLRDSTSRARAVTGIFGIVSYMFFLYTTIVYYLA